MTTDYSHYPPIGIRAYSDLYDVPDKRVWGDFWIKENLSKTFLGMGYPVDHVNPGIVLHLFGEPLTSISPNTYNILWIHSHPDWITSPILKQYQKIYCISGHFIRKLFIAGFAAEHLMLPTNLTPVSVQNKYDIVFVGNVKQNTMRKIISDLGRPAYDVRIWGWGWQGLIPEEWYAGEYVENSRLNEIYAAARIVLNDHHEDMRREGFINPRVLDVLASGGFVVSDSVYGMGEFLNNSVPGYETAEELRQIIDTYMKDPAARNALAQKGRGLALQFTYQGVCSQIIGHINSVSGKLQI